MYCTVHNNDHYLLLWTSDPGLESTPYRFLHTSYSAHTHEKEERENWRKKVEIFEYPTAPHPPHLHLYFVEDPTSYTSIANTFFDSVELACNGIPMQQHCSEESGAGQNRGLQSVAKPHPPHLLHHPPISPLFTCTPTRCKLQSHHHDPSIDGDELR